MTKPQAARPAPAPSEADVLDTLHTVHDYWRFATSRFAAAGLSYGQGTETASDEAAWLLLWSLSLPLDRLDGWLPARLSRAERSHFLSLVERRVRERIPTAYLTGEAWLRGVRFRSDARALVPRSLIAEALEDTLPDWMPEHPDRVLDLCTGGGSLAILCARAFPHAQVDATDLSPDALALARENLELHQLHDRIALFQGDLYEALENREYELIVCNPPYVNAESMRLLPPEFLAEPQGALAGGEDGMDLIRTILRDAPAHLAPGGRLLLEIGHEAPHFEEAFGALDFVWLPVQAGDQLLVLVTREQLTEFSGTR